MTEDLKYLEKMMEEMAGKPREHHVRQPGERQAREIYAERRKKLAEIPHNRLRKATGKF